MFDLKIEKPKKEEEKKGDAGSKKDAKKSAEKKKEPQKKAAPEPKKEAAPPVDKLKEWETNLPALKFEFYDYKTLFVNAPDKNEALEKLYSDWDDKALSFWYLHYQKYDEEETSK